MLISGNFGNRPHADQRVRPSAAALTLRALRSGDERFLHRFSTPELPEAAQKSNFATLSEPIHPTHWLIYTGTSGRQTPRSTFEGPATASMLYSAKSTPPTSTTTSTS